jgi:diguanylate cyclase (GGDEF)-like protein
VDIPIGKASQQIHQSICRNVPVLITRRNANAVERSVLDFFGSAELAITPLISTARPWGLLLADNIYKETPVNQSMLENLWMLADDAGKVICNARQYEKVLQVALTDQLTTLGNRRYLLKRLAYEMKRAMRHHNDLSVMMIDVDDFKRVNDMYGHDYGDNILRIVAKLMRKIFRRDHVVGRLGGEEFLIILPSANKDQALCFADRFREMVETYSREKGIMTFPGTFLTVSIGITVASKDISLRDLVRQADIAMYQAKRYGKNRCAVYGETRSDIIGVG